MDLTRTEHAIIVAALERYRIQKGAERKLKCQKDESLYPAYDRLLEAITTLQRKVAEWK